MSSTETALERGLDEKGLKMIPVESSNLAAIGYAPGPDGRPGNLYVEFAGGQRYVYADVPADVWEAFREAPSKGQYHARHVKGAFAFHKAEAAV